LYVLRKSNILNLDLDNILYNEILTFNIINKLTLSGLTSLLDGYNILREGIRDHLYIKYVNKLLHNFYEFFSFQNNN